MCRGHWRSGFVLQIPERHRVWHHPRQGTRSRAGCGDAGPACGTRVLALARISSSGDADPRRNLRPPDPTPQQPSQHRSPREAGAGSVIGQPEPAPGGHARRAVYVPRRSPVAGRRSAGVWSQPLGTQAARTRDDSHRAGGIGRRLSIRAAAALRPKRDTCEAEYPQRWPSSARVRPAASRAARMTAPACWPGRRPGAACAGPAGLFGVIGISAQASPSDRNRVSRWAHERLQGVQAVCGLCKQLFRRQFPGRFLGAGRVAEEDMVSTHRLAPGEAAGAAELAWSGCRRHRRGNARQPVCGVRSRRRTRRRAPGGERPTESGRRNPDRVAELVPPRFEGCRPPIGRPVPSPRRPADGRAAAAQAGGRTAPIRSDAAHDGRDGLLAGGPGDIAVLCVRRGSQWSWRQGPALAAAGKGTADDCGDG
jgi:hypothetical protein